MRTFAKLPAIFKIIFSGGYFSKGDSSLSSQSLLDFYPVGEFKLYIYTSYAVKVVNCNVHSMKSGEALAAPAASLLTALMSGMNILEEILTVTDDDSDSEESGDSASSP